MKRQIRTAVVTGVLLVSALALSACALIGPSRGADGQVTETTDIPSTTLLKGDCFTFVDGTDHNKATVTPCSEEHAYIVIFQGDLTPAEVDSAGGIQNAVSAACSSSFAEFKAAAAEGTKPEQEFIVSTETKDGATLNHYSCVATDASAAAAG